MGAPTSEPPAGQGHGELLAALAGAGYRVTLRKEGEPTVLEVRRRFPADEKDRGDRGFSVYLWTFGDDRLWALRLRLPAGRRPAWEEDLRRIAFVHAPEANLYIEVPSGRSKAFGAFRSDQVADYLSSIPPQRRRSGPVAAAKAPTEMVYREWTASEVDPVAMPRAFSLERELDTLRPKPVETAFSAAGSPLDVLDPEVPLEPATGYLFWFGVDLGTGASIEVEPESIPAKVPARAHLTVELFGFDGELTPTGPSRGVIEVTPERGARVVEPALEVDALYWLRDYTLFFPVRTPRRPGAHRLRCNLYHGSTLLQSRLVTARVGGETDRGSRAIESVLDYRLASGLDSASLAGVPDHDLSLFVNGDGDTHQFRLYSDRGDELFRSEASLPSGQVKTGIESGRKALRRASWGKPGEWDGNVRSYRYRNGRAPRRQLEEDLGKLARAGAKLYSALARKLAGGVAGREELEAVSGIPGRVQIASGPDGLYVPAALFYDHRVDPPGGGRRLGLCPDFSQALSGPKESLLQDSPCMVDGCRHRENGEVVCPSGFWGFRHEIGWPTSTATSNTEVAHEGGPRVLVGVSTDGELKLRKRHVRDVGKLAPDRTALAESLHRFDEEMRRREAHLVYLYCHGGMDEEEAFVELGAPGDGDRVTYDHLRQGRPWGTPPPHALVFVNGCHTTALGPEQILDLVAGFVEEAEVTGVIGTELTVFEPLACDFADAMLPGFLDGTRTVGAAIRHARLELLRRHNPLGLVYVPFVAADTRLVPA